MALGRRNGGGAAMVVRVKCVKNLCQKRRDVPKMNKLPAPLNFSSRHFHPWGVPLISTTY